MDELEITIAGRRLRGRVELRTKDGKPGAMSFDEGVPVPFGLIGCRQYLLLQWEGDKCHEIIANREVIVHGDAIS
jgi:hypothetical protein